MLQMPCLTVAPLKNYVIKVMRKLLEYAKTVTKNVVEQHVVALCRTALPFVVSAYLVIIQCRENVLLTVIDAVHRALCKENFDWHGKRTKPLPK